MSTAEKPFQRCAFRTKGLAWIHKRDLFKHAAFPNWRFIPINWRHKEKAWTLKPPEWKQYFCDYRLQRNLSPSVLIYKKCQQIIQRKHLAFNKWSFQINYSLTNVTRTSPSAKPPQFLQHGSITKSQPTHSQTLMWIPAIFIVPSGCHSVKSSSYECFDVNMSTLSWILSLRFCRSFKLLMCKAFFKNGAKKN